MTVQVIPKFILDGISTVAPQVIEEIIPVEDFAFLRENLFLFGSNLSGVTFNTFRIHILPHATRSHITILYYILSDPYYKAATLERATELGILLYPDVPLDRAFDLTMRVFRLRNNNTQETNANF